MGRKRPNRVKKHTVNEENDEDLDSVFRSDFVQPRPGDAQVCWIHDNGAHLLREQLCGLWPADAGFLVNAIEEGAELDHELIEEGLKGGRVGQSYLAEASARLAQAREFLRRYYEAWPKAAAEAPATPIVVQPGCDPGAAAGAVAGDGGLGGLAAVAPVGTSGGAGAADVAALEQDQEFAWAPGAQPPARPLPQANGFAALGSGSSEASVATSESENEDKPMPKANEKSKSKGKGEAKSEKEPAAKAGQKGPPRDRGRQSSDGRALAEQQQQEQAEQQQQQQQQQAGQQQQVSRATATGAGRTGRATAAGAPATGAPAVVAAAAAAAPATSAAPEASAAPAAAAAPFAPSAAATSAAAVAAAAAAAPSSPKAAAEREEPASLKATAEVTTAARATAQQDAVLHVPKTIPPQCDQGRKVEQIVEAHAPVQQEEVEQLKAAFHRPAEQSVDARALERQKAVLHLPKTISQVWVRERPLERVVEMPMQQKEVLHVPKIISQKCVQERSVDQIDDAY